VEAHGRDVADHHLGDGGGRLVARDQELQQVGLGDDAAETTVVGAGELGDAVLLQQVESILELVGDVDGDDLAAGQGPDDVTDGADLPVGLKEAVLTHPGVLHELGHVVADRVGQESDDPGAGGEVADDLHRRMDGGATGATAEEAFLADELASGTEGVAVVALDPAVDEGAVEDVGDEVVADALDLVAADFTGASEDGALGVDADDEAAGEGLLDGAGDAGDGAAGACGEDDGVELSAALLDDLGAGGELVGEGVIGVAVLIEDVGVGEHLTEAPGDADVAIRGVPGGFGGGADDLGAEGLEGDLLLAAHLLGHGDDHAVAADGGGHGEADAGVTAGGLDERVARLDASGFLGLEEHADADAILHGSARVHVLELGQELAGQVAANAPEAHQGGLSDSIEDRVKDGSHGAASYPAAAQKGAGTGSPRRSGGSPA
jgi:hypothetical protein